MIAWIVDGTLTGENALVITGDKEQFKMALSVSQDTLISVPTNIAGWTVLREPNGATLVDAGVLLYDALRIGVPDSDLQIDASVNPSLYYSPASGLSFFLEREP